MSSKSFISGIFIVLSFVVNAQLDFSERSFFKTTPDTLYLPFNEDGLQLIVINSSDTWQIYGSHYDAMYPRSGSWFMDHGPGPDNCYLWRDIKGKIIKQYNHSPDSSIRLRPVDYVNHAFTDIGLFVHDYNEFFGHFKFRGENLLFGLINVKGEIVVSAEYHDIRRFQNDESSEQRIVVQNGFYFGLLDKNLKEVFPPIYCIKEGYAEHHLMNGKYIKVLKNERCGLIDENGKVKIDFQFDDIRQIHDSMYMCVVYKDSAELKKHSYQNHWDGGYKVKDCFVYDRNFRIITTLKDYDYIYYWGLKQFIVKKNNGFGVMNTEGDVVIPLEYDAVSNFNSHYFVRKGHLSGVISSNGKMLLPVEFDQIQSYDKAVYVVQNKLIGVYNDQFELIAKPQFQYKNWDMGKYILTRSDGSKGFVEHRGTEPSYYQSPEGEKRQL